MPSIENAVLVMGTTGVGKSTIVNMLFNADTTPGCCQGPATVGGSADSVTKEAKLYVSHRTSMLIYDTVGLGDPKLTDMQILRRIRRLLDMSGIGLKAIVFVMKMQRLSAEERMNSHLLTHMLAERDIKSNGILVFTHWEGEIGKEDEDLEKWAGEDEEARRFLTSFGTVVLTNNSLRTRYDYPEARRRCLQVLQDFIAQDRTVVYPSISTSRLITFLASILNHYVQLFKRTKVSVELKDLWIRLSEDNSLRPSCGDCTVCHEDIMLCDVCVLSCNHQFHLKCISGWAERAERIAECPQCRACFTPDTWTTTAQPPGERS